MTWILPRKRSMLFRILWKTSRTNLTKSLSSNRRSGINRPWLRKCKDSLMKPCSRSRWWGETRLTEVWVIIAAKWWIKKLRPMKISHRYLKCKWVRCSKRWECLCSKCNSSSNKCSNNNSTTNNNNRCSHSKALCRNNNHPQWCRWEAFSPDRIPSLTSIWAWFRILYHKVAQLAMEGCHRSSKWTRIRLWIILRPT